MVTVIEFVVAELLHSRLPVNPEAVKTEFTQLSATDTIGVVGTTLGAATAVAFKLVQPLTASV